MNEIYGTSSAKKASLQKDISNLEHDIKSASEDFRKINEERSVYGRTESPEEANKRQRDIVFLKKDLENKKSEFEQLDQ